MCPGTRLQALCSAVLHKKMPSVHGQGEHSDEKEVGQQCTHYWQIFSVNEYDWMRGQCWYRWAGCIRTREPENKYNAGSAAHVIVCYGAGH